MKGWATFGIISCIFIVLSTLLCCGGFIYKTRVEHLYGLDALPGMAFLSAFLDAAGRPRGYLPAGNPSESHASQASWEHTHNTTQALQRTNDREYGSIWTKSICSFEDYFLQEVSLWSVANHLHLFIIRPSHSTTTSCASELVHPLMCTINFSLCVTLNRKVIHHLAIPRLLATVVSYHIV